MTNCPAKLDLPDRHRHALALLIERVPPAEYIWALTGSAGLRLQGVDVAVRDLDIQADGTTVYRIEKQLAEFINTPVHLWESTGIRSLDGKANILGVEIELLANISHGRPDGTWFTCTDLSRLVWIDLHGIHVPVFPLEDELDAYEAMGRIEKSAIIRETIQKAGK